MAKTKREFLEDKLGKFTTKVDRNDLFTGACDMIKQGNGYSISFGAQVSPEAKDVWDCDHMSGLYSDGSLYYKADALLCVYYKSKGLDGAHSVELCLYCVLNESHDLLIDMVSKFAKYT